jgi:hypothetical protein
MRTRFVVVAAAAAFALPAAAHAGEYFRCDESPGPSYWIVRPDEMRVYTGPELHRLDPSGAGYQTHNSCQHPAMKCSWSDNTKSLTVIGSGVHAQFGTLTGLLIRKRPGLEEPEMILCTPVDKIPYANRVNYADWVNGQIVTRFNLPP